MQRTVNTVLLLMNSAASPWRHRGHDIGNVESSRGIASLPGTMSLMKLLGRPVVRQVQEGRGGAYHRSEARDLPGDPEFCTDSGDRARSPEGFRVAERDGGKVLRETMIGGRKGLRVCA